MLVVSIVAASVKRPIRISWGKIGQAPAKHMLFQQIIALHMIIIGQIQNKITNSLLYQ